MYILSHSSGLIAEVLGISAQRTDKSPSEVFRGFVCEDLGADGPAFVFESPLSFSELPWRMVIEDIAGSSQMDRIALCGEGFPVISIAYDGRRFRGQGDHLWQMVRGNLAVCFYVPGTWSMSENMGEVFQRLQQLPCRAVLEVVQAHVAPEFTSWVRIQGVNDIVVECPNTGMVRKLSGCLTELRGGIRHLEGLRFGIGLNIGVAPELLFESAHSTTCLMDWMSAPVDRVETYRSVLFGLIKSFTTLINPIINRRFL